MHRNITKDPAIQESIEICCNITRVRVAWQKHPCLKAVHLKNPEMGFSLMHRLAGLQSYQAVSGKFPKARNNGNLKQNRKHPIIPYIMKIIQ